MTRSPGEMRAADTIRVCQAQGCNVRLSRSASSYCHQRKLCALHLKANCLQRKGHEGLWRFCQQCGKLELLQAFEGDRRSCRAQLARRRATKAAAAEAQVPALQQEASGGCMNGPQHNSQQPATGQDRQALQARLLWLQQQHALISQQVAQLHQEQQAAAALAQQLPWHNSFSRDSSHACAPLALQQQPGSRACWSPAPGSPGGSAHSTHSMDRSATQAASHWQQHQHHQHHQQQLLDLLFTETHKLPALEVDQAALADQLAADIISRSGWPRGGGSCDSTPREHAALVLQQAGDEEEDGAGQGVEDADIMDTDSWEDLEDTLEMALLAAGADVLSATPVAGRTA